MLPDAKDSCFTILRRIVSTKKGTYFAKSLDISSTTTRDQFRNFFSPFVENVDDYCLRSLKSGGASNDGYKLIDPELKDRHVG